MCAHIDYKNLLTSLLGSTIYPINPYQYLSALTPILLQLFELRLVYEPVDSLTVAYPVRQFLIYISVPDPAP